MIERICERMANEAVTKIQVCWDMMLCGLAPLLTFRWSALLPYLRKYALWTEQTMKMKIATPPKLHENTVTIVK
jgi:hypothetical protein